MNAVRSRLTSLGSSQSVVLTIICLGVFSTALDQTVVIVALPTLMVELEVPLTDLDTATWIITGYLVSYTVAMPLAGRLVRCLWPCADVSSGAACVRHRIGICGISAEFPVDRGREGDTGSRRRRDGSHRSGDGRGGGCAAQPGSDARTRRRLG